MFGTSCEPVGLYSSFKAPDKFRLSCKCLSVECLLLACCFTFLLICEVTLFIYTYNKAGKLLNKRGEGLPLTFDAFKTKVMEENNDPHLLLLLLLPEHLATSASLPWPGLGVTSLDCIQDVILWRLCPISPQVSSPLGTGPGRSLRSSVPMGAMSSRGHPMAPSLRASYLKILQHLLVLLFLSRKYV